tara:strand:- start:1572 stop:1778 length:207 start_codon:yes stop_codon:yes gene_type:complete
MTEEQKMKVLVEFRQLYYQDLWKLHLKLSFIEKTDEQYTELMKEKNELEKTIGNLTVIIMKSKGGSNG